MSLLDRTREKFKTPTEGTDKTDKTPSVSSVGSSHGHLKSCDDPSVSSVSSSDRDSKKFGLTVAPLAAPAGKVVECRACQHFDQRPGKQPDGRCRSYSVASWAAIPFACPGYAPADTAVQEIERRRQVVASQLQADSELRFAFDAANAPLRPEPGEAVSVVVGIRTPDCIVTAELHIPRERFDAALFFQTLDETSRRPQ